MRVVAISDLHGYLPKDLPEGDILCICGDIVPTDYQSDIYTSISWFNLEFVPWTDSLPYKKIIFIGGNHDFFLEALHKRYLSSDEYIFDSNPSRVLRRLLPGNNKSKHKIIYLCDNSVEIEGKVFYGTPYIKDLSRWAFYRDTDTLKKLFEKIPKKLDVLLTHQPPKCAKMGEVLQKNCFNTGSDYGAEDLANIISERDIKFAICGHVHSGCHEPTEINNTIFINTSVKDENYSIKFKPIVFNI